MVMAENRGIRCWICAVDAGARHIFAQHLACYHTSTAAPGISCSAFLAALMIRLCLDECHLAACFKRAEKSGEHLGAAAHPRQQVPGAHRPGEAHGDYSIMPVLQAAP